MKQLISTFDDIDDEVTDVQSIVEEIKAIINLSPESVDISNLSPRERVCVYAIDGKAFNISQTDSYGEVILHFCNASIGLYIIKTKQTSFKYKKK